MGRLIASLLLAVPVSAAAQSARNFAPFPLVQEQCFAVGGISFGRGGRWPACRITRARWYATLVHDNLDFYQVEYCLGEAGGICAAKALVLFSNRAYTPVAHLVMARIDSGDTIYDDLQVFKDGSGYVAQIGAHTDHASETRYFRWQDAAWKPAQTPAWIGSPAQEDSPRLAAAPRAAEAPK